MCAHQPFISEVKPESCLLPALCQIINFGLHQLPHNNMAESKEKLWSSLYKIVKMGGNGTGKHFWVFVPTGERVNFDTFGCNSELWGKAKHDKEVYTKIVLEAGLEGETEHDLDGRALSIVGSWMFREKVDKLPIKNEEDIAVERSSKEQTLSKELLYSCCHCSRSFVLKHHLRRHVARVHLERSYQCHLCPKKFARQDRLESHKLLHETYHPHVCITCKKKYKTKFFLLKHLKIGGGFCPLQCIFCTKTFANKFKLVNHDKLCRGGDGEHIGGTCELCLEKFEYRIDLERHRKLSTNIDGSFKFNCGRCQKNHCTLKMLEDHRNASEVCPLLHVEEFRFIDDMTEEECMYPCEKCGKRFGSKHLMMVHLKTHTVKMPSENNEFQCILCQKKFAQYSNYIKHKRLAYNDDGSLRNLCEMCSRSFCTSRLLKRHCNESHTVACTTCDQSFTTKRALDSHIQKRQSTCGECKKIFCNKDAFSLHKKYAHPIKISE